MSNPEISYKKPGELYAALGELEAISGVVKSDIIVDEIATLKARIQSKITAMQSELTFNVQPAQSQNPNNNDEFIQFKVKCCSGYGVSITFRAKPSDQVGSIMERIVETTVIAPNQMRLRLKGKLVEDGTMADNNIEDGSVLKMYLIQRGC